jgi:hypothetical protein
MILSPTKKSGRYRCGWIHSYICGVTQLIMNQRKGIIFRCQKRGLVHYKLQKLSAAASSRRAPLPDNFTFRGELTGALGVIISGFTLCKSSVVMVSTWPFIVVKCSGLRFLLLVTAGDFSCRYWLRQRGSGVGPA